MIRAILIWLLIAVALSCKQTNVGQGWHFTTLPASVTGIHFANTITENDSLNMFVNEYTYMGGGVGVGDFDRDGRPDLFFAGNQVSSRCYLNKGGFNFEDITDHAGLATAVWCTGVSVVDINGDGWPDIYVCVSGKVPGSKRKNLLFINQHDLTFKEQAADYGLADTACSTQALFFDYDGDGRLDMYLVNHTLDVARPNDIREDRIVAGAPAADKLYHNTGTPAGQTHPVYADVSAAAGIVDDGNGLGVVAGDFNGDGLPDLYVTNDYIRNDLLWLNNGNGTFTNCIAAALRHQSYSSMGTDAGDLNNDGLPDILTLDMQPETGRRKKMMYSFLTEQRHQLEMDKGYEPQYVHNMLQLNNGTRKPGPAAIGPANGQPLSAGRAIPYFSEIAEMAGIAETDWSWSVLLADLDNDGWKDVFITNGLGRDPTNIDFLEYAHNTVLSTGIPESDEGQRRKFIDRLTAQGPLALHSYLYHNNRQLGFDDLSTEAGITERSISNGAAYVDLDNDGDLDLVVNNINGEAFVRRNEAKKAHWLTLRLQGDGNNRDGIGALVKAYDHDTTQSGEQFPVRGYLSTMDNRLHFGFGDGRPDSLVIRWPNNKMQTLLHPAIDTVLTLKQSDALVDDPAAEPPPPLFREITQQEQIDFRHKETMFFDYQFQPLLPQKYSQEGPFISIADIDRDGREDFFVGGAFRQSGRIFHQNPNGSFTGKDLVGGPKYEEDMQSVWFDADGDGYPDLLVVGGSSEFEDGSAYYRPRLYHNDGKGNLRLDSAAFPPQIRTLAKSVAVADLDGDGDPDIFIGGRLALGAWPRSPRSYLLRNDHGHFTDVTDAVCPALRSPGMINSAVVADIDGDGKPDLLLAGDWMPVRIFRNTGSTLEEITQQSGLDRYSGFWRSLLITDIDHDGHPDIVAGNLGLNNPWHIDTTRPAELVAKDFDGNGTIDPVFCYYLKDDDGKYVLSAGISRDAWAWQMPSIKKRYETNEAYAKAPANELLTPEMRSGSLILQCNETRSGWFSNDGKGGFHFHPFPRTAQLAPVNAMVATDVDGDGIADLILAGNEYQGAVMPGRYDASYGLLLKGDGHGGWTPVPPAVSGLLLDGDVKDLKLIRTGNHHILLTAVNDQPVKAYQLNKITLP
jgi:hypothetical protein